MEPDRSLLAGDICRQRVSRMKGFCQWRCHVDEVYVKINGEMHYLWRAVDQESEVLEGYVTKTRDKQAALRFMKKALKRHGSPETITTDGLRSYKAAMNELGNIDKQEVGRWANNRVENSHLPFRRRERAMLRFRQMKCLKKFTSVHANVTTTLTSIAISSTARLTSPAAQPPWLSGRTTWPEPAVDKKMLRQSETSCD